MPLILSGLLLSAAAAGAAETVSCQADRLLVDTPQARLSFSIELADDPAERAQGLMFRRDMPAGHGMLFVYETPRPASFWMKNTLIPLDMIFIDPAGRIAHIHPQARPLDETPISGARPGDPSPDRLMVLEIAGGEAARLGLAVGQNVAHPALDPAQAALPCN